MINPEDYRVTPETVDGGDVDLDAEAVLGLDGRRITEADTQAFTTARGGRPSLTGAGTRSPRVSFRVPELIPYGGWVVKGGSPRARAARCTGRPLPRQGCCASLRDGLRPPLTREPLPALGQALSGRPGACPMGARSPSPLLLG